MVSMVKRASIYLSVTCMASIAVVGMRFFGVVRRAFFPISFMWATIILFLVSIAGLLLVAWARHNKRPIHFAVPTLLVSIGGLCAAVWIRVNDDKCFYRIKAQDFHTTEMAAAAANDDIGYVEALIAEGVDPNLTDQNGGTPLHSAASLGRDRIVTVLLRGGADPAVGTDPLAAALFAGHLKTARLLEASAGLPVKAEHLSLAVYSCNSEAIQYLLEHRLDPNADLPDSTPLLGVAATRCGADVARLLVKHGAKVDRVSFACSSPLAEAAYDDDVDAAKLLLELGAKVDSVEPCLGTPLSRAAKMGNLESMRFLVAHGAHVNLSASFETFPLGQAAAVGSIEAVDFLLASGAEINRQTERGTVLHCAASDVKMVKHLLSKGVDANLTDNHGKTPLAIARAAHWPEVVAALAAPRQ